MAFFDADGARLYYELTGASRPALVLIHGGGCTHRDWHRQVEALKGEFAVLAPDLRCHGQSAGALTECSIARWAADINALVASLDLAPLLIAGHSLASRIAAEAVRQEPANAAGLILLDGSRSLGGFAAKAPEAAPPAPAQPPSLAAIIDTITGPFADAAVRRHVFETMSSHSMELLHACAAAYEHWDMDSADAVFAGLPAALPVLAIQSTYHDKHTARRYLTGEKQSTPYLDFLKQARPDIRVSILPETGHFSMLERPAEVTALIRDFANSLGRSPWQKSA